MADAARVLEDWRKGERLLTLLPSNAPERPDVEACVDELRSIYQRVTGGAAHWTERHVDAGTREVESAERMLDAIGRRYDTPDANIPDSAAS